MSRYCSRSKWLDWDSILSPKNKNYEVLSLIKTSSSLLSAKYRFFIFNQGTLMTEEPRQGRSIKIKPSILRKAHHRAIELNKRLGQWVEEAIEEKIASEDKEMPGIK